MRDIKGWRGGACEAGHMVARAASAEAIVDEEADTVSIDSSESAIGALLEFTKQPLSLCRLSGQQVNAAPTG